MVFFLRNGYLSYYDLLFYPYAHFPPTLIIKYFIISVVQLYILSMKEVNADLRSKQTFVFLNTYSL